MGDSESASRDGSLMEIKISDAAITYKDRPMVDLSDIVEFKFC